MDHDEEVEKEENEPHHPHPHPPPPTSFEKEHNDDHDDNGAVDGEQGQEEEADHQSDQEKNSDEGEADEAEEDGEAAIQKKGKQQPKKKSTKSLKERLKEKIKMFCTKADVFASAHILPVHVLCLIVATVIIPISVVSIIWDLMAGVVFQKPDLSTIDLPAFVLFINFTAMPLAMYGYMMEYLMHERSRLALIGLVCVVVHPILFFIRGVIEMYFDGYRGEAKVYFEGFNKEGPEASYPIGILRYREGIPFSDSVAGKQSIENILAAHEDKYNGDQDYEINE